MPQSLEFKLKRTEILKYSGLLPYCRYLCKLNLNKSSLQNTIKNYCVRSLESVMVGSEVQE